MGCTTTKVVEVPIVKTEYVEKPRLFKDVPLCEVPKAKSLSVEDIVELALRQHTALEQCNLRIEEYNKQK